MRIASVSDIHGDSRGHELLERVIRATSPDLLIINGDITTFGPASVAESILANLSIRCAAVPGNCDPDEVLRVIEKHCISLHGKRVDIDGIQFVGLGGAPCCTLATPREIPDDEIDSMLSSTMVEKCVVVSHAPPSGILDLTRSGKSLGSMVLAEYVSRFRPRLVLSGHVHEARGVVEQEGTVFANPGSLKEGFAVVAELADDETSVKLADLRAEFKNL